MSGQRRGRLDALAPRGVRGHELIARGLRDLGLTHVYGVTGTPVHEVFAACSRAGVRPIGTRNQAAATFASAAHNYLAGTLRTAVIVSAGPAVTNTLTGLLLARDNGWPLLVLGGRRAVHAGRPGQFQDLDAVPVMAPLCRRAALVASAAELPDALERSAAAALHGRPGPVYLDVAEEALAGVAAAARPLAPPVAGAPPPDGAALALAAELLCGARRPLVLVGRDLRWVAPWAALRDLVERTGAPFVTAGTARGFLPDDHPLCVNEVSGRAQGAADVVLALGVRFDWEQRFGGQLARGARLIRVDAGGGVDDGVAPAVGVTGEFAAIAARLARPADAAAAPQRAEWAQGLCAEALAVRAELRRAAPHRSGPMTMRQAMAAVADVLPADAVTVLDGNVSMLTAQQVIPANEALARLTSGANGTMGVGVPFALAAKLHAAARPVVAVCGDSAFGFSAMELETAVRHGVAVVVVVMNNQGLSGGLLQAAHYPAGHERVAMLGAGVRNERVMEAFGGFPARATTPDALREALARALAAGRPACIDCIVDPMSELPRHVGY